MMSKWLIAKQLAESQAQNQSSSGLKPKGSHISWNGVRILSSRTRSAATEAHGIGLLR